LQKTDVLIVGAGPAGCTAAKTVVEAGFAVKILEEHPKVGLPLACGEGISQAMLDKFPWAPKEGYSIETQYLHFPGGSWGFSRIPVVAISRPEFDKKLSEIAENEGAELYTNTLVKQLVRTNDEIEVVTAHGAVTSAKIVIAADGPSSRMMKQMNLPPPEEIVQGIEYRINGLNVEGFHFYFDTSITPHGYGWIFDKGEETANVGICLKGGLNPRSRLDQFVAMHQCKGEIEQVIAGIIPSSGAVKQCYTDNFIVIGDAGGFTNPIFFGGIGVAMLTGVLAGETTIHALEEENYSAWNLAPYQEKVQSLPITSPALLQSHELLYHDFDNSDLAKLGLLMDGHNITFLTPLNKLILLGKILRHPTTWARLSKMSKIVKGFSISRDWGF